jgi:hypothetical protein
MPPESSPGPQDSEPGAIEAAVATEVARELNGNRYEGGSFLSERTSDDIEMGRMIAGVVGTIRETPLPGAIDRGAGQRTVQEDAIQLATAAYEFFRRVEEREGPYVAFTADEVRVGTQGAIHGRFEGPGWLTQAQQDHPKLMEHLHGYFQGRQRVNGSRAAVYPEAQGHARLFEQRALEAAGMVYGAFKNRRESRPEPVVAPAH